MYRYALSTVYFYYAKKVSDYSDIIAKEVQCFENLIEILRLISVVNRKKYILEGIDHVLLMRYIKHSLIECKIIYIDSIVVDNTELECEGYVLDFSQLDLNKSKLEGYDFSMVNLSKANLEYCCLTQANLKRANLNRANLRMVNFEGANLVKVDFGKANLYSANLREANLIGANLQEANLTCANLIGADLRGTNLNRADLSGAILDEKQIEYLKCKYRLRGINVYINETKEIITYKNYCK